VLLTFDDGGRSARYIGDALAQRGWRGHFFIVTSLVGTGTFLGAADVRALRAAGHVIGTHTHTHPTPFRDVPEDVMRGEWRVSIDILAQLLGEPCVTASVPGGDVSRRVFASADAAGIRWLFTSEPTLAPEAIGGCVVLGRFVPKVSTSPAYVGRLAAFRGWHGALLRRRARNLLRDMLPGVYRAVLGRRGVTSLAAP
jgi:peptidoglycan/xylan/chitin deacetylase (PgdA/CDA1 family)